eukprot:Macronucleus_7527.p1 GENE.Macronucleus_7527~~Macronucleus_7527.p1  ORF type:complete len:134 (+),score=22.23 Macronucleus_7527:1-402(+)
MTLLNEVDKPGSDVEVYAKGLDRVLLKKIEIITGLRERLLKFYSHLKTEEHMSKLFERNQEMAHQSAAATEDDTDNVHESVQNGALEGSGNLVDDILNGAYQESQEQTPLDTEGDLLADVNGAVINGVDLLDD